MESDIKGDKEDSERSGENSLGQKGCRPMYASSCMRPKKVKDGRSHKDVQML
jgi:hypothetical protein